VRRREGNRPDRRLVPHGTFSTHDLAELAKRLRYGGSGLHKLRPGDYGFVPSINPRPTKSVCDDLRPILLAEARNYFEGAFSLKWSAHLT
jgi:hypothetical protein